MGCAVAFFCALADALGVYVVAESLLWAKVIAFSVVKGMGAAGLFMKQHPVEAVRDSKDPGTRVGLWFWLLLLPALIGCASFSTTVFRLEKAATDAAYAGVGAFNSYYAEAALSADSNTLATLNMERGAVYDCSRSFSASVSYLEGLRSSYETNSALKGQVRGAVETVSLQSSNLVWIIEYFTKGATHAAGH